MRGAGGRCHLVFRARTPDGRQGPCGLCLGFKGCLLHSRALEQDGDADRWVQMGHFGAYWRKGRERESGARLPQPSQ